MINTYIPNVSLNIIGLLVTSYFIFHNTLRKNDLFAFIMVMYFCSLFPYLTAKGGAFNHVGFVTGLLYLMARKKLPGEYTFNDKYFKLFAFIFFISSVVGWLSKYTGDKTDLLFSVFSFLGVMILFLVASRIIVTGERIKIFIQINMVLIVYSTIASLNKYIDIVPFNTPLLPIYAMEDAEYLNYFEGGGIIGSSPLYGEHSMILAMLFATYAIIASKQFEIRKSILIFFTILSVVNVFMSISRSVFLLTCFGILMIIILQFKFEKVRIPVQFFKIIGIILIGFVTMTFIKYSNLDYVFDRVDNIYESQYSERGISLVSIIDGSTFNRTTAFTEAYAKYDSKESWWLGYGWGLSKNNREAFFVDPNILRSSAHSQIFAILFMFGWLGFIAYFGLIIRLIWQSYQSLGNSLSNINNRIFAYFFMIAFILFLLNEIKADSVYIPGYFAATMILLGLAYSNLNALKYKLE